MNKIFFICHFNHNLIRIIKCLDNHGKKEFLSLVSQEIPAGIEEDRLFENFALALKAQGYNHNRIIVSVSRQNVTSRYIKVPSQKTEEIEKIISLQSPSYLPYTSEELITGYQVLSEDKYGYTHLALYVLHRVIVDRLINNFQKLKIKDFIITPSSYGLGNLFNFCAEKTGSSCIIIDYDFSEAEIAIMSAKKILFSRYVKLGQQQNVFRFLADEVNKTKEVLSKDIAGFSFGKIFVLSSLDNAREIALGLGKELGQPVIFLPYVHKIKATRGFLGNLANAQSSFTSLIGLALKEVPLSLNLLPFEKKAELRKILFKKEKIRRVILFFGVILILGLAMFKNIDNRTGYLNLLKVELDKFEKEAGPLALLERRFEYLQERLDKSSTLDVLSEVFQYLPADISLTNLGYENGKQVILRGQAMNVSSVFNFISGLEKSKIAKGFNISIKYASKMQTAKGEVVDFEISCIKK